METSSVTPLVLVADDEPTMLELVSRHLKTMDDPKVEVIEASDGEQAWKLAREHLPDLVVQLPGDAIALREAFRHSCFHTFCSLSNSDEDECP